MAESIANGLVYRTRSGQRVFRVGYAPDPWEWTDWRFATDGRFTGRWDDPGGRWRTLYVARTAMACYLELLARFRPDPSIADELDAIDESPDDAARFPTPPPGVLPRSWAAPRMIGEAGLSGRFAVPTATESVSSIRTELLFVAGTLGMADIDTAALRAAEPREFTQAVSEWIHDLRGPGDGFSGVEFESRHGDDQVLWAVYEQPTDGPVSRALNLPGLRATHVESSDPDLRAAMAVHHLRWESD